MFTAPQSAPNFHDPMQGSERSIEHHSHNKQPLIFRAPGYDLQSSYSPSSQPDGHTGPFYPPRVAPVTQLGAPYLSPINDATAPSLYQKLLSRIEGQQEDLQNTRDRLVGSRFRLRTKREELKTTREQAAIQIGISQDLVRIYLLENEISLPENIQNAIQNAEQLRDTLGTEEVEYEEMEEAYNVDEWKYSQDEYQFVEDLGDALTDGGIHEKKTDGVVAEEVLHVPVNHSDHLSASANIAGAGSNFEAPELLSFNIQPSSLEEQLLEQAEYLSIIQHPNRAIVWPSETSDRRASQLKIPSEQYVDKTFQPRRQLWHDISKRINTWLLGVLNSSKLQQQHLKSLWPENNMSEEDWWELVQETWSEDCPGDILIQTGETTVSHGNSLSFSSVDMNHLYSEIKQEKSHIEDLNILPFITDELKVDALDTKHLPPAIESSDLIDRAIKHVTSMERTQSARSMSTQQTTATRGSSKYGDSVYIDDDRNSMTSSEDLGTIRKGELGDGSGRRPWLEEQQLEMGPPEIAGDMYRSHRISNRTASFVEDSVTNHRWNFKPGKDALRDNIPPQADSSIGPIKISLAENPVTTVSIRSSPISSVPQATKGTNPSTSPFEPFIQIDSPEKKPWRLPLLRLTPSAEAGPHSSIHRLAYLPFVEFEDSPLFLPGPSTFPAFGECI